jgi:hypothetical protein
MKKKIEADYTDLSNQQLWTLEEDKKMKGFVHLSQSDLIDLNVGGKYFTTTIQTLKLSKSSKLMKLIEKSKLDSKGRIFIDRPPKEFELILTSLRSGNSIEGMNETDQKNYEIELEYYKITGGMDNDESGGIK